MNEVRCVLLIDDDEDDRFLFTEAVKEINEGIACICASGAEEGLQILKKCGQLPDLIFLDLNMPRINGKQCLQEIRRVKKFQGLPVIIYSTAKSEQIEEEVKNMGASLFMVKPNSYDKLKKELTALIGNTGNR